MVQITGLQNRNRDGKEKKKEKYIKYKDIYIYEKNKNKINLLHNENKELLVQKLLRISEQWLQNIKPSMDSF